MADFCNKCNSELFGIIENYDVPKDMFLKILCEGCGKWMYVDSTGFQAACQFCVHGDEGVCEYAGEIGNDYLCDKFERRK